MWSHTPLYDNEQIEREIIQWRLLGITTMFDCILMRRKGVEQAIKLSYKGLWFMLIKKLTIANIVDNRNTNVLTHHGWMGVTIHHRCTFQLKVVQVYKSSTFVHRHITITMYRQSSVETLFKL